MTMGSILFALAWPGAASGRLDGSTALVSLASTVLLTGFVGWYAHCREQGENHRREAAFLAAIPVGGVH
jgi:hypothetical protein